MVTRTTLVLTRAAGRRAAVGDVLPGYVGGPREHDLPGDRCRRPGRVAGSQGARWSGATNVRVLVSSPDAC